MIASLRFIFRFIVKEKLIFSLGLFLTFLSSILAWLGPRIIAWIIDQGLVPHHLQQIWIGVVCLALAEASRLSFNFLGQTTYSILGQNVIERVRKDMIAHLLKLPIHYFDRVSSGSMMTRVVNDANSLTDFFQSGFVSILGNFAGILAIFIGLFSLNFKLGFILLLSFLPVVFLCSLFSVRLRRVYEDSRNQLSELNARLADFLFGMKTVRALGISDQKHEELSVQVKKYEKAQMGMVQTFALFHPAVSLGIGILLVLLIWLGLPLIGEGALKVGQWVAALSYVLSLQQPLVEISDRWNFFVSGLTAIDRIQEVFEEPAETYPDRPAPRLEKIEFKGLSFSYLDSNASALKDVNFSISRGDWIGIFGESGSGKSTLLQMLYGFYHPSLGSAFWNGETYLHYHLRSLRSHFGVVEQFPFLFSGTIRDNITLFGQYELSVDSLAQTFQGYPLIESLLRDLDFQISERGGNLSMGQKQMITFMRAYLSEPDIWILDEATAFFDREAEQEVIRALLNLQEKQITVIQVAHKPEALTTMKRIWRVDQGIVSEVPKEVIG